MTLFSIGIRDDGEELTVTKAPHQGDDCDGLVYRARNEDGHDVFLFFISAFSQGEAVITAREMFDIGDYVALDPMWQPGSIWPDTADISTPDLAQVQIYSERSHGAYITPVPTHKRTNPFIDHFGERIMWAYMRDIEERLIREATADIERWQEIRRRQEEQQKPVGEPTGTVANKPDANAAGVVAKQLFLDFG